MAKNIILEINNLSVSNKKIATLQEINMKVYKGSLVTVNCSEGEAILLAASILCNLRREIGSIYVKESYLPKSSIFLMKDHKWKIRSSIKFIDPDSRSMLTPNLKIGKSLIKLQKKSDNLNQEKKRRKAKLFKDTMIKIGEFISNAEIKDFILNYSANQEKRFYAKRNIKHYKQLRRFILIEPLENWISYFALKKRFKELKNGIYKAALNNKISDYISNTTSSYRNSVIPQIEKYEINKKTRKKRFKEINALIREEKVKHIHSYFEYKDIKRQFINFRKRKKIKRKGKFKYSFIQLYKEQSNESIFEEYKRKLKNFFWMILQIEDWLEHRSTIKKLSPLLNIDPKIDEYVKVQVMNSIDSLTTHNTLNMRRERIKELASKLEFPLELLDNYANDLSKGEQFNLSFLAALLTKPDILLVRDSSSLDQTIRGQFIKKIQQLNNEGQTIVLFTESIEVSLCLGDYAYIIKGSMIESGDPNELLTKPVHPYTQSLLFQTIPALPMNFSINEFNNSTYFFNVSSKSTKISSTHYVYEDSNIVNYWLESINEFELKFTKRFTKENNIIITLN